ncbi:glycoside hydrolase family 71/99-like protein [Galbibacter pacificus]|uniref:Glycoside hydrolase family 71/99-like protein n=1 Tax=Galbibacter pacificus TaxID=2996052 RepID=A0ABT6FMW7_9FLAO|nr:glycoside hydrolase family 71/99-like protein [Galbibacter pacificus]MDG3581135.1 glycoside hydrolase family 71/99-like protein [Galbibacter pacificus]MDG3584613.1 glycoside hydrolase family 71/99-like protein [Galbibacter pacificus]
MYTYTKLFSGLFYLFFCCSCDGDSGEQTVSPEKEFKVEELAAKPVDKSNSAKLLMHYMSWFETKGSSGNGQWGYHWTMNHSNPDVVGKNGKREIASHYYPLIGPYHSGDKDVIEYHLLLMKYAGVDGILIDWYGTYNLNDYAIIHENAEQLIAMLDKVGLEYAFVYEDRFLNNIVEAQLASTPVEAAKKDMVYLRNNHFGNTNYIQLDHKPLLMVFGPITLKSPDQWISVFDESQTEPSFLTLWNQINEAGEGAVGEYAWVYKGQSYLEDFYQTRIKELDFSIGSAYPGFEDFYAEAGVYAGIDWEISPLNGQTFKETLMLFKNSSLDWLQLITWNDFGEGTAIEPTDELGFKYIEALQDFAEVSQNKDVFDEIYQLYQLRKLHKDNSSIQLQLDQAFYHFVALQPQEAKTIINSIKNKP